MTSSADGNGHVPQELKLFHMAHEGNHDLGLDVDALLLHLTCRFHDGPHLHLVDLGEGYPEAAAAVAEHGVGLVQRIPLCLDFLHRGTQRLCHFGDLFVRVGQEFMERRVEEPDGYRAVRPFP